MNLKTSRLTELTGMLHRQNETLGKARNEYLLMEAQRKHFESKLVMGFKASNSSMAEATAQAQGSTAWLTFHQSLARLEAVYEFQKLKFTIIEKEYQSCYLEMKLDQGLIQKEQ